MLFELLGVKNEDITLFFVLTITILLKLSSSNLLGEFNVGARYLVLFIWLSIVTMFRYTFVLTLDVLLQ